MKKPRKSSELPVDASKNAKADILAAALKAFARDGFEGASMPKIARIADVAPALIHYYFGSKDNLWREAVDHSLGQLRQEAAMIRNATRSLAPLDRLRTMIQAFTQFAASSPDQFVMVIAEARSDSDRFAWIRENYTKTMTDDLASILTEAIARKDIIDAPVEELSFMIMGSVLIYFTVYPGIPKKVPQDKVVENYAELLFNILIDGLKPR